MPIHPHPNGLWIKIACNKLHLLDDLNSVIVLTSLCVILHNLHSEKRELLKRRKRKETERINQIVFPIPCFSRCTCIIIVNSHMI